MGKNHGLESSCAGRRKDTLAVLVCIKKGAQTLPLLAAARKGSNLRWIEYFPANLDSKGFFFAYGIPLPFPVLPAPFGAPSDPARPVTGGDKRKVETNNRRYHKD